MTTADRCTLADWLATRRPWSRHSSAACIDALAGDVAYLDRMLAQHGLAKPGDVTEAAKAVDAMFSPAVYVGEHKRYAAYAKVELIEVTWAAVRTFVETRLGATCRT